jgi:hypothetical protein
MLYSVAKVVTLAHQKFLQGGEYMLSSSDVGPFYCAEPAQNERNAGDAMICRYFKVAHRDMVFLKFILEAYEGMNVMSTVDNKAGIIRIAIMPGFVDDMDRLLAELGKQVTMEPTEWHDEPCTF